MAVLPRHDRRRFDTSVTVTCTHPGCGIAKRVPPSKRNDYRWPGEYCDGPPPISFRDRTRHPLAPMLGPEGKAYA